MSDTIAPLWFDYRLCFPRAGIALALDFLNSVRAAGFMGGTGALPDNALGDARDRSGNIVTTRDPETGMLVGHAFTGRPGMAAFSYPDTDPITGTPTGETVNVPAAGDPAIMYLHIRSPVSQAQSAALQASLGLHPADYGITPSDPTVSAAVLGVWA
jgi:hypothetical protein